MKSMGKAVISCLATHYEITTIHYKITRDIKIGLKAQNMSNLYIF